jgi:hypothetical protein
MEKFRVEHRSEFSVPGHLWPGYKTAPDESGFSPIYGAS